MQPLPNLDRHSSSLQEELPQSLRPSSSRRSQPIYLNVYDFWPSFNACCSCCGIGVYHTGVQFYHNEYIYFGFDGDEVGVGYLEPKSAAYEFKEQILLGFTTLSEQQIEEQVMEPLYYDFIGSNYDLLQFNCNHFSLRLAQNLKTGDAFPPYVFSVTDCCNKLRCCLPNCILNGRLDWFASKEDEQQYEQLQENAHVHHHHDEADKK